MMLLRWGHILTYLVPPAPLGWARSDFTDPEAKMSRNADADRQAGVAERSAAPGATSCQRRSRRPSASWPRSWQRRGVKSSSHSPESNHALAAAASLRVCVRDARACYEDHPWVADPVRGSWDLGMAETAMPPTSRLGVEAHDRGSALTPFSPSLAGPSARALPLGGSGGEDPASARRRATAAGKSEAQRALTRRRS